MEYSDSAAFDDRPSLAVINRNLPVPSFTHTMTGKYLSIEEKKEIIRN